MVPCMMIGEPLTGSMAQLWGDISRNKEEMLQCIWLHTVTLSRENLIYDHLWAFLLQHI